MAVSRHILDFYWHFSLVSLQILLKTYTPLESPFHGENNGASFISVN